MIQTLNIRDIIDLPYKNFGQDFLVLARISHITPKLFNLAAVIYF
jgi:hypothetical protein